ALAEEAACPLTGGDTVSTSGPTAVSITAFGAVPRGGMVRRGDAAIGDRLVVTGTIGDGAIGLEVRAAERAGRRWPLADDHAAFLRQRYLAPRPRVALAKAVRDHARAAMDISDGLVGDLAKMVTLSGHGADVRLDDVPLSVAARAAIRFDPGLEETAMTGGDDYEILTSVPEENVGHYLATCLGAGVQATVIGVVTDLGAPIRFLDADGKERSFRRKSYEHGA
ncbi:MAG: thiamine-phosphate kinase, partial [Beijerinckiaceae bacterium]